MNLTAIFESWHIGDGNYPPLSVGELVNLSFELELSNIVETDPTAGDKFQSLRNGEYRFVATILRVYDRENLAVMETNGLRFYIAESGVGFVEGRRYSGEGTLLLDHYAWVESLGQREDPPNLFYHFEVTQIRKVNIPDRFVSRHDKGKSLPTRLAPDDYSPSDVESVVTMQGQPFDEEFYIIDLDDSSVGERDVPRTFHS
jgi:hypothetical protein